MSYILTSSDLSNITLNDIEEGFESTIEMSAHEFQGENGLIDFFDDGSQYDKIGSTFSAILDETNFNTLISVYNSSRDQDFTLSPSVGRGFALFTPAFGDLGNFIFKIKKINYSSALNSTVYKHFRVTFTVLASSPLPAYSPSLGNDEGNIQIGTIGGLRYPIGGFQLQKTYDLDSENTGLGVNYSNDFSTQNEITKFKLRLLHDKMSLLIKQLRSNRYDPIDLIVPNEVYPFGAEFGGVNTFSTRLLNKKLKVTQIKNKRYEIELTFQRLP